MYVLIPSLCFKSQFSFNFYNITKIKDLFCIETIMVDRTICDLVFAQLQAKGTGNTSCFDCTNELVNAY